MLKGILCISLDFELHWGRFDKMPVNVGTKEYFKNTRKVIPELLKMFSEYDCGVTWATVGMLFHKNQKEWSEWQPSVLPGYANPVFSSYEWVKKHGFTDMLHFAPDLIGCIKETNRMEIGTHTYSHYYCNESGQTADHFKQDLLIAKKLAAAQQIELKSLVFPRNQFNETYLSVCREMGIEVVRSNPSSWYWNELRKETMISRITRTGDAYISFNYSKLKNLVDIKAEDVVMKLPASRLYRSWVPQGYMNQLKLNRILSEMTRAAIKKQYYHLWWHPHNFGTYPDQCIAELKIILDHYSTLHDQYGFTSMGMFETASYLRLHQGSLFL